MGTVHTFDGSKMRKAYSRCACEKQAGVCGFFIPQKILQAEKAWDLQLRKIGQRFCYRAEKAR